MQVSRETLFLLLFLLVVSSGQKYICLLCTHGEMSMELACFLFLLAARFLCSSGLLVLHVNLVIRVSM
jgi:hypothetical protein